MSQRAVEILKTIRPRIFFLRSDCLQPFIHQADAAALRCSDYIGALVVTESEGALEQGSAINFVVLEDRVGFEVSLEAAERTGHRISARLLAVARRVLGRAPS